MSFGCQIIKSIVGFGIVKTSLTAVLVPFYRSGHVSLSHV